MIVDIPTYHRELLSWYETDQRELPWRKSNDPYAIWVSEIMLQQTQVKTVLPYYQRFMASFPTVKQLADADINDVLKHWEGLGYYSRARNLHRAAATVQNERSGHVPKSVSELKKLPGIGDYTAAAIASIAFNQPVPAVDGNIKRVFSRLMLIKEPVNQASSASVFKRTAEKLMEQKRPGDYNQALMELGAMICRPTGPECTICPISQHCMAFREQKTELFPRAAPRPKVPTVAIAVGVVVNTDQVLITQRKTEGLLGGLWEFPGGKINTGESPENACLREIGEETGLEIEILKKLTRIHHAYSHFKIKMDVFICRLIKGDVQLNGPVDFRWIRLEEFDQFAFPGANHKFLPLLKKTLAAFQE